MAGRATKWIGIAVVVFIVLGLWVGALTYLFTTSGSRFFAAYNEEVIEEGSADKVALITISGVIDSGPPSFGGGTASDDDIVRQLDQALEDPAVVSVILELNTPGGAAVASDNIHDRVLKLRREGVPVVALMKDVAASGGYHIAAGGDEIVANPSTITGSIGAILTVLNLEGTAEKIGIKEIVIKSGAHKDIGSPFRDMTSEELAILQKLVDEAYDQFVTDVARDRNIDEARVREIGDGRVYTGKQAKDLGLIDHLGGRDVAIRRARALSDSSEATLVRYLPPVPSLFDLFLGFRSSAPEAIKKELGLELRPGIKYLWIP